MYISTERISVFTFIIIAISSWFIAKLIASIFGLSALTVFTPTLLILTLIFLLVMFFNLEKIIGQKETTSYPFSRFEEVYNMYRNEVINIGIIYQRFVENYYSNNVMISYSIDANGNQNVAEYHTKNSIFNQIIAILQERKDLVDKYFNNDHFTFQDYENLIRDFETTYPPENNIEVDTLVKLNKVKGVILKYESGEKTPKHYGHRMFGYLLKEGYFNAGNNEQRQAEWEKFTGLTSTPEPYYLNNPDENKNQTPNINKQLKQIAEIFDLIGLKVTIDYHKEKTKRIK